MRIAFFCTNEFATPLPKKVIYAPLGLAKQMVEKLAKRGHRITFFASKDSKVSKKIELISENLISLSKIKETEKRGGYHNQEMVAYYEQILISKLYQMAQKNMFDLIHIFHLSHKAVFFTPFSKIPTLFTLHDPIEKINKFVFKKCPWTNKSYFVSLSNNQQKAMPNLNFIDTIYNGIDIKKFKFSNKKGKYLAFLGRICETKGAHLAIKIAKELDKPLRLAGNIWDWNFWQKKIKPYLNKKIKYEGMIEYSKTSAFLEKAEALLMPIQWEEPFGLVMIEAMACGTPVIGFRRGSVPEVVKDEKTGFVVDNLDQMAKVVKRINQIDRKECRKHVEKNFTVEKMVDGYERVYQKIIKKHISP